MNLFRTSNFFLNFFFAKNRLDRKVKNFLSYKKLYFSTTFSWESGFFSVSLVIKIKKYDTIPTINVSGRERSATSSNGSIRRTDDSFPWLPISYSYLRAKDHGVRNENERRYFHANQKVLWFEGQDSEGVLASIAADAGNVSNKFPK